MGNAKDIREAVEEELGHDPLVDAAGITVRNGVKYPSQRAAAESAVAGLTGVRSISDEIDFVFDVDPADGSRLVRQALDSHEGPGDDSHVLADASGNSVTLIGHARTVAQRDAVVAAAWRGHAVKAVIDQFEITG